MSARFFAIFLTTFSAVWLASAQDTKTPDSMKCSTYARANTKNALCNDRYTCTGGCEGPFVAGPSCLLITQATDFMGKPKSASDPPNNPVSNVKCTVGFGKNSAAANLCITETERYSCTGETAPDSYAMCHGCGMGSSGGAAPTKTPTSNTTPQAPTGNPAGSTDTSANMPNTTPHVPAGTQAGSTNTSATMPNTTPGTSSTGTYTTSNLNTTATTPNTPPTTSAGNTKQFNVHQGLTLAAMVLLVILV